MHARIRPALALALTGSLAVAGAAGAAAPNGKVKAQAVTPVCNLILDEKGDTFLARAQDGTMPGPQEDALDIVSGDISSDGKTLTGVYRVNKLATSAGTSPGGVDFRIAFTLPGQDPEAENFVLNMRTDNAGAPSFLLALRSVIAEGQSTSTKLADGTGVFDTAKNEVRMSVPLDAVKSGAVTAKAGDLISFAGLDETSARPTFVNPVTGTATALFADVTTSEKTYKLGTPSCVTPGK